MCQHEARPQMTAVRLLETLNRIALKDSVVDWDWKWEIRPLPASYESHSGAAEISMVPTGHLIAATFTRPDTRTGESGRGRSRWEFIAPDATRDNVVKTAFVVLKLTTEHELMEAFHYMGARIFNPHNHVDRLRTLHREPGQPWEEGIVASKPRIEEA